MKKLLTALIMLASVATYAQKISELPAATTLGGTEVVAGVQGGTTKKISINQINTFVSSFYWPLTGTGTLTGNTTIDGDGNDLSISARILNFTPDTLKLNGAAGSTGQVPTVQSDGSIDWETPSGGGGGHTIEDEGTPLTQRTSLNFVGSGVAATDDSGNDATVVTIPISPLIVAASDELSSITTGVKRTFRMPSARTLTDIRASLTTAQGSGSLFTVDVLEGGVSILSTLLTFDNTGKTTTTATTPVVISDSSIADDAEMQIEVTQIGDGTATGLKITFYFQ